MTETVQERVHRLMPDLPRAMRRVAHHLLHNPLDAMARSASELGGLLQTSDATVIRTAQALGYEGLAELKRALADELAPANPASGFRKAIGDSTVNLEATIRRNLAVQARTVGEVARGNEDVEAVARLLSACARIVLFGQGPTGHIAAYAGHLLRRHGHDCLVLQASGTALADELLALSNDDGVLALCYGKAYAESSALFNEALRQGLPTVLVTDSARSELAGKADSVALVPRGESGGLASHAATVMWLETLVLALGALVPSRTDATLTRLQRLRSELTG